MPFIDIVVRTSVVLLVALVTTLMMRRQAAAATRHLVWTLAVTGALLLPIATKVVPAWPILPELSSATTQNEAGTEVPAYEKLSTAPELKFRPTYGGANSTFFVGPNFPPSRAEGPLRRHLAVASAEAGSSGAWLLAIWAVVAVVLLARMMSGIAAVHRLARHARPADARWRALLDEASDAADIRRRVRLLVSPDIALPMTWGRNRPTLLLPVDALSWTDERARVVLLHELAHVRRGDYLTHVLGRALASIHWFNPLAWIAVSAMTRERERACDDFVLARGARPSDYAQHLLDIAREGIDSPSYAMAPAMARASELEGRLLSILTPHRREPRRMVAHALCAVAVFATIAVASAATEDQAREVPAPSSSAPAVTNWLLPHDDSPEEKAAARARVRVEPLAEVALTDTSEDAREKATLALGLRSEPEVVDPLRRALKDPSSQVREKAALGLALRRDPRVVDSLLEAANDPDSQVREKVAIALGLSGDERALDALNESLHDPDPQVREKAASGLTLFSLSSLVRRARR